MNLWVTARLNEAEQCHTCVDTRIISNASRNLEAAVDTVRLFIVDCKSLCQTDIPTHMQNATVGRPKFVITREQLEFLPKDIGFSWVDIANLMGVSISTILRRQD